MSTALTITLWTTAIITFYLAIIFVQAYLEAKMAPRKPMFQCDKNPAHGMFLKEHCVQFGGVDYCPLCFHESSSAAERAIRG